MIEITYYEKPEDDKDKVFNLEGQDPLKVFPTLLIKNGNLAHPISFEGGIPTIKDWVAIINHSLLVLEEKTLRYRIKKFLLCDSGLLSVLEMFISEKLLFRTYKRILY